MENFFIYICIILVASILQTSTGFGFSIMATPFLLLLFAPSEAIQINIILSLIISLSLIMKVKKNIDTYLLKKLVLGSIMGLPLGGLIYITVDIKTFKLLISIILLLLTLMLIVNVRFKSTTARDYIVGGISGVLTISIGMPGPPLLIYFAGTNTGKEKTRATTLAFFLFIYLISLLSQLFLTGTDMLIWRSSLYAIPAVFIGLIIGQILFKYLNQQVFKIFTYILLGGTGIYLLIDSILS
ncbi:sulfite exporter TauE/SafE family protein [Psychrobacillus sp. NEAU-3TGS]|uniref:sulfite exporter TauE/SafE family protein n=1 Tax=Psychrobacillus sp. NEAU-3TGS TaxID=2995412 RepID=UPI00249976CF|nr:sulfite exporter TauE/SafE family protein [Psychrobacillus sp. NEAU-3TGS]MDI2587601.1 sulfite exporter TauE/SafE family protein [Psychrobacillus sp. NEAU-3TGS]